MKIKYEKIQTIEYYEYEDGFKMIYYEVFALTIDGQRKMVGWVEPEIVGNTLRYIFTPKKYFFIPIKMGKDFLRELVIFMDSLE